MKLALRIGVVVLVVLVLVGAGALFLRQRAQNAQGESGVPTAVVTRGSIEETVSATGNVAAERESALAFRTSGPIAQVLIEAGQAVQAGDLLARLDTASLEWQVARAEASVSTSRARLAQAQQPPTEADLASARAALENAQANYEKVQAGPTAEDLASAQAGVDSARKNYVKVKGGPTAEDRAAAQASLDSARAAVRQAQAAYDRVSWRPDIEMLQESLTLQNASIEMDRAQANYDALAARPTASDLAAAEAQVAQAEAQLAQLRERPTTSELAAARAQVAQAEAQLAQLQNGSSAEELAVYEAQVEESAVALAQAQAQLEDALITAPFTGTVLAVQAREGEWANPGAPAMTLAVTDPLLVKVNFDEVDVPKLAEGQTAHLVFSSLDDQKISGQVARIAPASSNVGGAVAYAVEINFAPGDVPVRLGMTADVDIVAARADDTLLLPNRAITADREAGRYYVTRQRPDGTTEQVEVRIGLRNERETQILDGVQEGDQVLLAQLPAQDSGSARPTGPFGEGGGRGPFGGSGSEGGQ